MSRASEITGAQVIAESLAGLGISVVFGIVGIPVVEIADACIAKGIKFISFRNEQSASYAAQTYGYITGRPGVCLVVGGPGVVHAMAGVINASVNCWPMLLLAGHVETDQVGMGGFQELDQVSLMKLQTKFAAQPSSIERISFFLEKAYRYAFYGRPGPTFIDFPADFIRGTIPQNLVVDTFKKLFAQPPSCPVALAAPDAITEAAKLLRNAKSPLIVIGKGSAYAKAEHPIRDLINFTQIPFLPTPMGKGVVPDSHPLNVAAARSSALAGADVVLLLGARLNWILHFGASPKWRSDVKFLQVDIAAEEIGNNNIRLNVGLWGDIGAVAQQLTSQLEGWTYASASSAYLLTIRKKIKENEQKAARASQSTQIPMTYHRVFAEIRKVLADKDIVYVSEGANTMDISRSFFDQELPRKRIDAGTFATMGVAMGSAIAAQLAYPNSKVVGIVGDSSFGFSAMEIETAVRSHLPLLIFVINNNGIYFGLDKTAYEKHVPLPSTALSVDTRYDMIAEACGGKGFLVRTPTELSFATSEGYKSSTPVIVNVLIEPGGQQKLNFNWMSSGTERKGSKL